MYIMLYIRKYILIHKKVYSGPVAHAYNPSYLKGRGGLKFEASLTNSLQNPILKIPNTKHAAGVTQVIECLPNKCEVLSSRPIIS
jgi:hypothetical protein